MGLLTAPPLSSRSPPLATDDVALGRLPRAENHVDGLPDADAVLDHRPDHGAALADFLGLDLHEIHVGADGVGEVALVDDQQIRAGDSRAPFAGHLVTAGDVDDVDDEVGQFARVVRRQVVAAGFDEQQVGLELGLQALQREQVGRDVFPHRRVGTAARLDGDDAIRRQRAMLGQEFGVLAREDVVRDRGDVVFVPQRQAEFEHERGLAAADGPADADRECPVAEVAAVKHLVAVDEASRPRERLVRVAMAVCWIVRVRVRVRAGIVMRVRRHFGR